MTMPSPAAAACRTAIRAAAARITASARPLPPLPSAVIRLPWHAGIDRSRTMYGAYGDPGACLICGTALHIAGGDACAGHCPAHGYVTGWICGQCQHALSVTAACSPSPACTEAAFGGLPASETIMIAAWLIRAMRINGNCPQCDQAARHLAAGTAGSPR